MKKITLLCLLLMFFASSAEASSKNYVTKLVNIASDGLYHEVGTFVIEEDKDYPDDFTSGDVFILTLPSGVEWDRDSFEVSVNGAVYNDCYNFLANQEVNIALDQMIPSQTDRIEIKSKIKVDQSFSGDVKLQVDGKDSGISSGDYLIARAINLADQVCYVNTTGKDINKSGAEIGAIKIRETYPGSIVSSDNSFQFELPEGFTWDISDLSVEGNGDQNTVPTKEEFRLENDAQTLIISIKKTSENRTVFEVKGLKILFDETISGGPIICSLTGDTKTDDDPLIIGKYFKVISTDPCDNATDIPLDKTISLTFFENIRTGKNFNTISIMNGEQTVFVGKNINGSTLYLDPTNNLEPGVTYNVNIPDGALKDYDGLSLDSYSFSFTTKNDDGTNPGQPEDECFIATAAYGSKFEPAVVLLRNFRDQYLLTNSVGQAFVKFYYHNSPPIANFIADNEALKWLARIGLMPIVGLVYLILHPIILALSACSSVLLWVIYRKLQVQNS